MALDLELSLRFFTRRRNTPVQSSLGRRMAVGCDRRCYIGTVSHAWWHTIMVYCCWYLLFAHSHTNRIWHICLYTNVAHTHLCLCSRVCAAKRFCMDGNLCRTCSKREIQRPLFMPFDLHDCSKR